MNDSHLILSIYAPMYKASWLREIIPRCVVPAIPISWDDSWFFMIHVHDALLVQLVVSQCHVIIRQCLYS
jgi:hypothetical protein